MAVKLVSVTIEKPEEVNLILGQAHFVEIVEIDEKLHPMAGPLGVEHVL